jgi:hypothetical protein
MNIVAEEEGGSQLSMALCYLRNALSNMIGTFAMISGTK